MCLGGASVPLHAFLLAGVQRFQSTGVQHHDVRAFRLLIALKKKTTSVHLQEHHYQTMRPYSLLGIILNNPSSFEGRGCLLIKTKPQVRNITHQLELR